MSEVSPPLPLLRPQALADADTTLVQRIERANGKKYLRKAPLEEEVDTMPQGRPAVTDGSAAAEVEVS